MYFFERESIYFFDWGAMDERERDKQTRGRAWTPEQGSASPPRDPDRNPKWSWTLNQLGHPGAMSLSLSNKYYLKVGNDHTPVALSAVNRPHHHDGNRDTRPSL